ncbi:MAG TPA: hypothetical protein VGE98_13895, partial [Thermoanaerobaculia bacterium]
MKRRPRPRRRRKSSRLLLPLLGLAAVGAVAAVVLSQRDDEPGDAERLPPEPPEREPEHHPLPATSAQWI